MKRRGMIKGLAAIVIGISSTRANGFAKQGVKEAPDLEMRSVFKVIENRPVTHVKIGDDDQCPTDEELKKVVKAFKEDQLATVLNPSNVKIEAVPNYILVRCDFADLKKGDTFILYEDTGELVVSTFKFEDSVISLSTECSASLCLDDAFLNHGVWGVRCDPVKDIAYTFPPVCPV